MAGFNPALLTSITGTGGIVLGLGALVSITRKNNDFDNLVVAQARQVCFHIIFPFPLY